MPAPASFSFLDPALVAKLPTMELRARRVAEGLFAGRHRSVHHGQSLEFAGHRSYTAGDEWRRIDWKVFAKTDRWVVREEERETELRLVFLLDASRSMAFASEGRVSKFRYASVLSAGLGLLATLQRESVGLGVFTDVLGDFLPARGGAEHLARFFHFLENISPGGKTDLSRALGGVLPHLPRRGLVFLLSDFLGDPADLLGPLRTLLARKHEVAALQVLDPEEIRLSSDGDFLFEDMETGRTLRADSAEIRDLYARRMNERLEKTGRLFASLGVHHQVFETSQPFERGLSLFLERRGNRRPL